MADNDSNRANQKTQVLTGLALLIIILGGIYFASRGDRGSNDEGSNNQSNQQQEQANDQNQGNQNSGQQGNLDEQVRGNLTATGTLKASENPARGNYVLESNRGNIYISTSRDYSAQVGKEVTLQANGTLNKFTFLGFSSTSEDTGDAGDVGGAPDEEADRNVVFNGTLRASDNTARGNYMIVSGTTKVYYQSKRDYSSWVGSQVSLHATGSINSFTNGLLVR